MKGFDAKFIEELKNRVDIVEIVGKVVQLEKRGANYWGRCPFHHEKTPSFSVNQIGQFYHCFGCHRSGDVISFVMETESLDFADAVAYLAERAQMKLPETTIDDEKIKKQRIKKERTLAILSDAEEYYRSLYLSGKCKKHEEYVEKRKLSKETVETFSIGASDGYDGLPRYLSKKGYEFSEMVDSGAVGETERNGEKRYYDFLGGRLIIPVFDSYGKVVAFCGRIIEDRKDVGKYVNTKETIVFTKGKTLFNLNNLKRIKNEEGIDGVIVVEGHMDVISLYQAGIKNVVASMGTALTKDQARIIKRYSDKVFISYDGDFAGRKAAIRGLEILRDEGLEVKVVSLPDGLDPDDVVKNYGKEGYLELVRSAMPLIDFKLDVLKKTYDLNTVDGKRKYVASAVRVIKESPYASEQEDLLKTVRDLTGVTMEALKRDLYNAEAPKETEPDEPEINKERTVDDKIVLASRFVLASYIFGKDYAKNLDFSDTGLFSAAHREIAEYLKERAGEDGKVKFGDLFGAVDESLNGELTKIADLSENVTGEGEQYYKDCLKTLKIERINQRIEDLKNLSKSETDAERRRTLVFEMSKLIKEKQKIQ